MKVSVLILTFNEVTNLSRSFEALAWCGDIVVIDSGSTDGTVELARARGARVLSRPFDTFAGQRNFGLDAGGMNNEWVLHLDADEVVTPEFAEAIQLLEPMPGIDGYRVPSKLMLYGRWIKFAGMYPTYQVRIGHRDRLRFKQVGHGQREDVEPSRIGVFDIPYLHYSFSHGIKKWLQKHVQYAYDEADLMLRIRKMEDQSSRGRLFIEADVRRTAKALSARLPFAMRPFLRFGYVYIWRQGFRDGRAGFYYAFMLSVYEGMIAVCAYDRLHNTEPQCPVVRAAEGSD